MASQNNVGGMLEVDLATGKTRLEVVPESLRRDFLGGAGLNAKLLYDRVGPEVGPTSPENVLVFGAGPLVGTGFMSGARLTVTAKGPLSHAFADSNAGGSFGAKMRVAGIDHVLFLGSSPVPVYLLLRQGLEPELLDARDLWGKTTDETLAELSARHPGAAAACIGPAGENLVSFACIQFSGKHAAGRTGLGCVMGSKKLKAIVVVSEGTAGVADPGEFGKLKESYAEMVRSSSIAKGMSLAGTLRLVDAYNSNGTLLSLNGQKMKSDEASKISFEEFHRKHETGRKGCFACPIACIRKYSVNEGERKGLQGEKIDYGSVVYLGPNLGIYDYPSILALDELCAGLGLDTMEMGAALGLAMECSQRGILRSGDFDGAALLWGDSRGAEKLVCDTAHRRGLGNVLAEGVKRAGERLGGAAFAFHVKGVACAPQANNRKDWALGYVVSPRGGDHLKAFPFSTMYGPLSSQFARRVFRSKNATRPEVHLETGRVVWWHENYKAVVDSLGLCIFAAASVAVMGRPLFGDFARLLNAAAGTEIAGRDVFVAAERILQIERAFNARSGITSGDDRMPKREPTPDADPRVLLDNSVDCSQPGMLDEYYAFRGCSPGGSPTAARLKEVGLDPVAGDLAGHVSDFEGPRLAEFMEEVAIDLTPSARTEGAPSPTHAEEKRES